MNVSFCFLIVLHEIDALFTYPDPISLSQSSCGVFRCLYEQEYKPERVFPNVRARVTEKRNRQGTLLDEERPVAERIIIDLDNETNTTHI